MQKRFWFFPAIDLWSYIKKYPFVFTFSLLSALAGTVEVIFRIVLYTREAIAIPGFSTLVRCIHLGIPLFALIHLLLRAPWLSRFKSAAIWHCLGLALLVGFFAYFYTDPALDNSLRFSQLYALLVMALLMLPVLQRLNSAEKQWAYLTDLILAAASAFLTFSALGFLFNSIYSRFPNTFMSYFFDRGNYSNYGNLGFAEVLVGFLVVPWFVMGCLERSLDPDKKEEEAGAAIGTTLAYTAIVGVLICYLLDVFLIIRWALKTEPIEYYASYPVFFFLASCALGLASLVLLTSLRSQENESWINDYRKLVLIVALPILSYTFYVLLHGDQTQEMSGYLHFLFALWLFGTTLYYLLHREASWGKPALALLILTAITLAGPLSPRDITYRQHRSKLEKLLKDSGMMKDNLVIKPAAGLEQDPYSKIQTEFSHIANYCGLDRLQPWFAMDLRPLYSLGENERRSGGYTVASRLMQALGVELCGTLNYQESANRYSTRREGPLNIAGYSQEQRINFSPGCPVIRAGENDRMYVTGLSDQNRNLTVQFGSEFLADVPLEKITQVLKAHDYNDVFRHKIPQDDLSIEFENQKVKVKVYFQDLQAFRTGQGLRIASGSGTLLVQRK